MRRMADCEPWKLPATIDDPAILDEISEAMMARGIIRDELQE
jgi:propionyl-CoA synthetase